MKKEQINHAIGLGRTAFIERKMRFPWKDQNLVDALKIHQESIPGNAKFNDLLEAWLKGWDLENLRN